MPTINATVKQAKQVWASPDGQKKIFKLVLDVDGGDVEASSYSEAVAKVGWTGELDTYEKEGKYGAETFVRQPKKEGFSGGFGGGFKGKPQGDQYTMYLSYAKDVLVAMMNNGAKPEFDVAMQTIIRGGRALYDSRPSAETVVQTEVVNVAKSELDSLFNEEPESKWKA